MYRILIFLFFGASLAACESDTADHVSLDPIPSSDGTIAFLDEDGQKVHVRAHAVWDLTCSRRFKIIADSSDRRFEGLVFLEGFLSDGIAGNSRNVIARRNSGDSIVVRKSRNGMMVMTDTKNYMVSGHFDMVFSDPGQPDISYTRGTFTKLPFEIDPLNDSNIHFPYKHYTWISHFSELRVFDDSVTLDGSGCFPFVALDDIHITIAATDTGTFTPDAFTHISFNAIDTLITEGSSFKRFSTVFTRKEDPGTITITKIDLPQMIIEGEFSILATTDSGNMIQIKNGIFRFGPH